MKRALPFTLFTIVTPLIADDSNEQQHFQQTAQSAIQAFSGELKSALLTAMKQGGPVEAISVCQQVAPALAAQLSAKYDLNIGRTSLKVRNPDNRPDAWETAVLNNFEYRLKSGEAVNKITFTEKVTGQDNTQWRMMKAIPTGKLCLTCHGEKIAEPVQAQLNKLYAEDQATGFKLGDIRGAFSVSTP